MRKGSADKKTNPALRILAGAGNFLIGLWLVLVLLGMASAGELSETSQDMGECATIEDDAERLECYDKLAGRKSGEKGSYFSQLWELDEGARRRKYAIKLHRSTYVLPFTYNESPNVDAVREADPDEDLKKAEVNFQLSLKVKLWQDIFVHKMDTSDLLFFLTDPVKKIVSGREKLGTGLDLMESAPAPLSGRRGRGDLKDF
jgi:hypothetical protein